MGAVGLALAKGSRGCFVFRRFLDPPVGSCGLWVLVFEKVSDPPRPSGQDPGPGKRGVPAAPPAPGGGRRERK